MRPKLMAIALLTFSALAMSTDRPDQLARRPALYDALLPNPTAWARVSPIPHRTPPPRPSLLRTGTSRTGLGKSTGGTTSLSGTIYQHDSITPAARVLFALVDTFGYALDTLASLPNGTYGIYGLQPGSYGLVLLPYGSPWFAGTTTSLLTARWTHVSSGQQVSGVDVILPEPPEPADPGTPFTMTISGTCFEGVSTPIPSSQVVIRLAKRSGVPAYPWPILDAVTDGGGNFSKTVIVDSGVEYYGMVEVSGMASLWLDGSPLSSEPASISMDSSSIAGLVFHFRRGASISGSVVAPGGGTLHSSVRVSLLDARAVRWASWEVGGGWSESFSFRDLSPGDYYLLAEWGQDDRYRAGRAYTSQTDSFSTATPIHVVEGQAISDVWPLPLVVNPIGYGTVEGSVRLADGTIASSGNVTVEDRDAFTRWPTETRVLSDGSYRISVKAETPSIVAFVPPAAEYYICATYYPNATTKKDATAVSVPDDGTFTAGIQPQIGGSIAGAVADAQGAAVFDSLSPPTGSFGSDTRDFMVRASNVADSTLTGVAYVTELSRFRIPSLPVGDYDVRAMTLVTASGADASFAFPVAGRVGMLQPARIRCTVVAQQTTFVEPIAIVNASGVVEGVFDNRSSTAGDGVQLTLVDLTGNPVIGGFFYGPSFPIYYREPMCVPATPRDSALNTFQGYESYTLSQICPSVSFGGTILHFQLPNLPSGDYYLCAKQFYEEPSRGEWLACLTWYGSSECIPAPQEVWARPLQIPAGAAIIHVTNGQTTGDIWFGSGSPQRQSVAGVEKGFGLWAVKSSPRGRRLFGYNLGRKSTAGRLDVYLINGKRVASIPLSGRRGTAVWAPAAGAGPSRGCYVFCLVSGTQRAVVRASVVW